MIEEQFQVLYEGQWRPASVLEGQLDRVAVTIERLAPGVAANGALVPRLIRVLLLMPIIDDFRCRYVGRRQLPSRDEAVRLRDELTYIIEVADREGCWLKP